MSDQPEKDPEELQEEKVDYVEDVSGGGDPEVQPQIGTDPMSAPEEGVHKTIISPDPEKVRQAEREGKGM